MCILSLDSSTLPSASITPGKVRRAAATAGEHTAATLLWKLQSDRCPPADFASSPAARCGLPVLRSSICVCSSDAHTAHRWRRASTELQQTDCCHLPTDDRSRHFPSPRVSELGWNRTATAGSSQQGPIDHTHRTSHEGLRRPFAASLPLFLKPSRSHMTAPWDPSLAHIPGGVQTSGLKFTFGFVSTSHST